MSIRPWILPALLALLAGAVPDTASADCVTPVGPAVTSSSDVTRLNAYAEGASVCIHEFNTVNACTFCESGYYHQCQDGYWRPQRWRDCGAADAVRPDKSDDPSSQPGASNPGGGLQGGDSGSQPPAGGDYQPDATLCQILETC